MNDITVRLEFLVRSGILCLCMIWEEKDNFVLVVL